MLALAEPVDALFSVPAERTSQPRRIASRAAAWPQVSVAPLARVSRFPGNISRAPQTWLERTTNLVRFTQAPRGGHFAPLEEPEFYAAELRAFFRPYRA